MSIRTSRRHTSTSWGVRNSNHPLSTLEIGSIHASLRDATKDLEQLARDLADAKRTVKTLSKRHHALQRYIATERGLLSPIRGLPRELLAEIFMFHSRIFEEHEGYIKASLLVSQVCEYWRRVAHSTAVLWVRFPVYYLLPGSFRARIPNIQVELHEQWIKRAGTLSCDVALRKAPELLAVKAEDDFCCEQEHSYLQSDRNTIPKWQWKMLDICYACDNFVRLPYIHATHLTLHLLHPKRIQRRERICDSAPNLEELYINCEDDETLEQPVPLPILPLKTLKRCEIDRLGVTNGLQILNEAVDLETLKWTTTCVWNESEDDMPHVTTNIHTLHLNFWDVHCGGTNEPLFNHLTAPKLTTLRVLWPFRADHSDDSGSPYWDATVFRGFIERSEASLTTLTLLHADIPEKTLIKFLEQTPFLGLHQMLGPRLLRRLLPTVSGELGNTLVPKLEVLLLRGGFEGNDMCDADILRVYEARYPHEEDSGNVVRLREGALHLMRAADEQLGGNLSLAARATRLQERGLKMVLTTLEDDPDDVTEWETDDGEEED
ncbi:hypothetical protein FB45DRAFT_915314 [Roridomyces roridus]|uniref:F-box domain-containing protein n=1 Tax=Roridomyces roridus TaxID=1738132 RepID=A0AAD7FL27_9AGAR|nr:hypothetical protein FB45DRAFT_915314 [Roridomyces roridus]